MTDGSGLTITVIHMPGAMTTRQWWRLRSRAPGPQHHELRLRTEGAASPSGAQVEDALRRWAEEQTGDPHRWRACVVGSAATGDSAAGKDLVTLPGGSPELHPGMVLLLTPQSGHSRPDRRAGRGMAHTLRLCVDRGPDAGQLVPLRRGRHTVGRTAGPLRLADPAAAREHVAVEVGTTRVGLRCADDAPDIMLGGRRRRRAAWDSSAELMLGSSALQLVTGPPEEPSGEPWPTAPEPVHADPPQGRHRMVLLMALLPMVIGIVLVAATGMWFFLLFSAVSGMVALGTAYDARRRGRAFLRATEDAGRRWAHRAERTLPTPGRLIRLLRLGTAELSAPLQAGSPASLGSEEPQAATSSTGAPSAAVLRAGRGRLRPRLQMASGVEPPQQARTLAPAAVVLSGGACTVISGPPRERRRLLRWLLVQLLLRPAGRRPQVLLVEAAGRTSLAPPPAADHPGIERCTPEDLRRRTDEGGHLASAPRGTEGDVVPVLVAPEGLNPGLLTQAAAEGMHVILTENPHGAEAGSALRRSTTLQLAHRQVIGGDAEEPEAEDLIFDGLSAETVEEHLRLGLRHCAGSHHDTAVPAQCERPLPDDLMQSSAVEELTALIGRGAGLDEHLDLVGDGPHILVAGTSGSGKSELLKSLLLGWAARYGPEEVNFMLFDFKGGSTFHQIARLEHALGLVTDLSRAQAERTLEGIRSELVRRERLFLDAEAGDYAEYRRRRPHTPLARLLVVFDEFRIFSHELPETMDELMRLATLGRSLGLHLVLATQRPQGVVTADIRANIGSILTLRLRSGDESRDLVGTDEAGAISRELPGRGILRRPGEDPRPFQAVQLTPAEAPVLLLPETGPSPAQRVPLQPPSAGALVTALQQAAESKGRRRRHTPIQPPLPEELDDVGVRELTGAEEGQAVLGLIDDPAGQRRTALTRDLERPRSLALLGEGESGGREALVALTRQLLSGPPGGRLHLLDGDRSLKEFADHPRVSSWVAEEHLAEAEHLLEKLKEELHRRRAGGVLPAAEILLMSGHGQWHAAAQTSGPTSLDHALGTLISEGSAAGISAVIAGGRELATGRLGARLSRRVLLPFSVAEETRHLWPKIRSTDPVPGRGVLVSPEHPPPGIAVQLIGHSAAVPAARPAALAEPDDGAIRVRPLPERLSQTALPEASPQESSPQEASGGAGGSLTVIVGVEQFSHAPATLELGRVSLITGLPGSGCSSCLALLEQRVPGAVRWGAPGSSPSARSLPPLLLVDDADRLAEQEHREIERLVLEGVPVAAAARPGMSLFSTIPWAHHARSSPGNVLLSPTHRSQADPHAVNVPLQNRLIPGRAVHLLRGGPQQVQWALPGSD